jgi:hypothetical protein
MKYYDGGWFAVDVGDWLSVPLSDGTYALGVVARAAKGGILLGYFFGPRRGTTPTLVDTAGLTADGAVLVGLFGSQGLRDHTWSTLGRQPEWNDDTWPIPVFVNIEPITGLYRLRHYDARLSVDFREEWLPPGITAEGPDDGLMGSGFVQARLDKILPKLV